MLTLSVLEVYIVTGNNLDSTLLNPNNLENFACDHLQDASNDRFQMFLLILIYDCCCCVLNLVL